jgi:hypothetical protein
MESEGSLTIGSQLCIRFLKGMGISREIGQGIKRGFHCFSVLTHFFQGLYPNTEGDVKYVATASRK